MAVYTWVGGSGDWFDPNNWTTPFIDSNGNTVVDASGNIATINGVPGSADIAKIPELGGEMADLGSQDVTVAGLTQSYGTITGNGTLTVTDNATFANGQENGTGKTLLKGTSINNGYFTFLGGRVVENAGTLNNEGIIVLGSYIRTEDGAGTLTNDAGATFDIQSDGVAVLGYSVSNEFYNAGLVEKSAGMGVSVIDVNFANTGTVDVKSGTLSIDGGGGSDASAFTVDASATLRFGNGTFGLGGTLDIAGNLEVGGAASVYLNQANIDVGGTTTISGSATAIFNPATVVSFGSQLTLSGGVLSFQNTTSESRNVSVSAFTQSGGTLTGNGYTLTVTGDATFGGRYSNGMMVEDSDGTTLLKGTTTFTAFDDGLIRPIYITGTHVLQNAGTMDLQNNLDIVLGNEGPGYDYGGTLKNDAGATFDIQSDGTAVSANSDKSEFDNAGLVEKSVGSGTNTINANFVSTGMVDVKSGTLEFTQSVSGTGTFSIADHSTLKLDGTVASDLTVDFKPGDADETLSLGDPGGMDATISNFASTDTITFAGTGGTVSRDFSGNAMTVKERGATIATLHFAPGYGDSNTNVSETGGIVSIQTATPCYCTGTRILTDKGEVAVEDLAVGDLAVTASGETRTIVWLGHRAIDIARHPEPAKVWPVRVQAGAFGENSPSRHLWMSPGHKVFVEGVLIPVKYLLNGSTVAQVEKPSVEYWHIELDRHDIILAENLPAESYLDTGNRAAFANGGAYLDLHPDFEPKRSEDTCIPLVKKGPEVVAAKAALLKRAAAFGHVTTADAGMHVMADGRRFEPIPLGALSFAFALPAGCASIELRSRTSVPAETQSTSTDTRRLGICVKRVQINGKEVALDNEKAFVYGWHRLERR